MPEETAPQTESLNSVIDKAAELINDDGSIKEVTEKKKPAIENVEKKEDKKEDELSDEDKVLANNLFKSLKNPDTAPAVIDWLAKQNGYTKAEVKELKEAIVDGTKKEIATAKDEIVELFAEQFGDEFAAKLAPAIKKAIEKGVEERVKPIHESFEQQNIAKLEAESNSALNDIAGEFYSDKTIPDTVVKEMDRLMDQYKPTKDQSLKDYLSDIHVLAAAKKGGSLKPVNSTAKTEKVDRNRNDPTFRLNGNRTPSSEKSDLPPAKNLDEAIRRAEEALVTK